MPGYTRPSIVLSLVAAAFIALMTAASAQNTIKVVVNDTAITTYDISQRAKLMRLGREKGGTAAATEQLINEALEMQEARRLGLRIPDARVNQAFATIAGRMKLSTSQLVKALGSQGVTAATLKKRLMAQMAWQELVKARLRHDASVKPSDVTAALFAEGNPDKLKTTEFTLQQIIFVVPKGSSTAYVAQRRHEASTYRARFTGCADSIALAKNLKDVAVRDIGRRSASELTGPRGEEIRKTPAGKTTPPNRIDSGVELIAVCSTRDVQSDAAARAKIENKLALEQSGDIGKDYLAELRKKAVIQKR